LDGEWKQIQMFSDSEIISQMAVVVGKLRGSTTNINQPADQNPFKACKTKLKVINDQNISDRKKEKSILRAMIEEHQRRCSTVIDSTHRNYIINGLLRIEFARQKSLKRETNENGFEMTGIYPFNMDKMIQNCKIPISDVERAIWANQLEPAKVLLKDR
jgi:hypothetical protein